MQDLDVGERLASHLFEQDLWASSKNSLVSIYLSGLVFNKVIAASLKLERNVAAPPVVYSPDVPKGLLT